MLTTNLLKSIVLIASMTSVASAYLTPGNGGGNNGGRPPHYCENPYGPCDHHGNPVDPNQPPPHQGYPSYPGNPQPGYPSDPNYPSYGDRQVRQVYIGRSVRNERLAIGQMAGLASQYQGWEVVAVRAQTRPDSPSQTIVQLISSGRVVAEQRNPGYSLNLTPNSRVIIGGYNGSLELSIFGSTQIDTLEIELVSPNGNGGGGYNPNPNPGYGQSDRIDINIYRSTYGNDRVDLTSYIDMNRFRGMRIESVEIRARSDYNVAIANLLVNSFDQGGLQFSGGGSQVGTIRLNQRPVIGQDASSLVLQTRGNMTIETVVLRLSRY